MKRQPRIMIADDLQVMRRLLKSSLSKAGFQEIIEASNGEELLKKLDEVPPDIVICDWDMPRLTGIDVLRHLRSHDDYKDIPFIMVTAMSEAEQVKEAIEAGINGYIIKPIKPELFVNKVKQLLAELQLPAPASA